MRNGPRERKDEVPKVYVVGDVQVKAMFGQDKSWASVMRKDRNYMQFYDSLSSEMAEKRRMCARIFSHSLTETTCSVSRFGR